MSKFSQFFKNLNEQKVSNFKVVAFCVLAATTFWVLNALNKDNYITLINYPIEFSYDKEAFMAVEELPEYIRVSVGGNGWDLLKKSLNMDMSPFTLELENPDRQNYLVTRNLERPLAEMIAPTQLNNILIDSLHFRIDKVVSSRVNVVVDTSSLSLSKNHRIISNIEVDPSTVLVKGPISIIEKLEGNLRLALEEDKISDNYEKLLPLSVPREFSDFLTLEEQSVLVSFEVTEFLEGNKRLSLTKLNFPEKVRLADEVNSVMLTYIVDERYIEDLKTLELEGILNYTFRNKNDSTITVLLNNQPKFLESIKIEPERFRLIYDTE
ncbi:YbbR-like domain-containing protein [Pararhodonellum marinum]|uniref:YbbR-like domain-containing protein n=1 Tax=Pararhodonellum marinum TaxID=2755358 RepID=UPI00188FC55C|nr:YbbR-like domain-containing protein [Pararhodonellum marinum]